MAQWTLPKTAMATVSWIGTAHTHPHPLSIKVQHNYNVGFFMCIWRVSGSRMFFVIINIFLTTPAN